MSRLTVSPLPQYDPSGGHVKITAPFGDGRNHKGVDWGTTDGIEVGTTLYAPVNGVLENTGHDGNYSSSGGHTAGLWLFWRGDNGTRWKMFHTNRVTVATGSWHPAGAPIAEVGNSGTQAAHLHLEEHVGGWSNPIDMTADCHEVINAGRWPGGDGPLTQADLDAIERVVDKAANDALAANHTGPKALQAQGQHDTYEIMFSRGVLGRRHIPNMEQLAMLQWVDHLAGSGDAHIRVITNEAYIREFNNLPVF
jgi:Peptidase family M23